MAEARLVRASAFNTHMEPLPEHHQPSSDARIIKWVGALAALTLGALAVRAGGRSRA
jgi:hypothetical protein